MSELDSLLQAANLAALNGDDRRALELFLHAARTAPHDPRTLTGLGRICLRVGETASAIEALTTAASLAESQQAPAVVRSELYSDLAEACIRAERWNDAAALLGLALQLCPENAGAVAKMAVIAERGGDVLLATRLYQRSAELDPLSVGPLSRLADLLARHGDWTSCIRTLQSAIHRRDQVVGQGGRAELYGRLGVALAQQQRYDEAACLFQKAVELNPDMPELHGNIAYVEERRGNITASLTAAEKAVELMPHSPEAFNNLGMSLRAAHRCGEARRAFEHAAALRPDFAQAVFNAATCSLLEGDLLAGWPGFESRRWTGENGLRQFETPEWRGGRMTTGPLLVHADQGLGDTFQFCRFLSKAAALAGCEVIFECQPELADLMTRSLTGIRVIGRGDRPPTHAAHVALASLPGILQISLPDLPGQTEYVKADAGLVAEFQRRLQVDRDRRPIVGCVWRGNRLQFVDDQRSVRLSDFAAALNQDGIRFVSLQVGDEAKSEFDAVRPANMEWLGDWLHSFTDTAAVLAIADLVISVDTSVAHLAGALGRPTWVLLPHTPDWRWMLGRDDSPWYPSARLFRQNQPRSHADLLAQVAVELGKWEQSHRTASAA
jgi:Flp pilus assembly protein TadD